MINDETLRKFLANKLGESPNEIGGGLEYGQFWNGPDEYPYDEILKEFMIVGAEES